MKMEKKKNEKHIIKNVKNNFELGKSFSSRPIAGAIRKV